MPIINTCENEKTGNLFVDRSLHLDVCAECFSVGRMFLSDWGLQEGNSQELNKYLGDKVDLIIQNKSTHADKRTAEGTMAAFFSNHKVGSFNVNHQGKRDESGFVIGTLMTANGNFRVNCFFRKVQSKYVIHQIRIDKTDE